MRHLALLCAALFGLALATVPACRKDDGTAPNPKRPTGPSAEGPAEHAGAGVGATIDKAAHDVHEGASEAATKTEQGAKTAASAVGTTVEKAGQKMKP